MGWEDPWRRAWQPTPVFLPGIPWTEKPGGLQSDCKNLDVNEHTCIAVDNDEKHPSPPFFFFFFFYCFKPIRKHLTPMAIGSLLKRDEFNRTEITTEQRYRNELSGTTDDTIKTMSSASYHSSECTNQCTFSLYKSVWFEVLAIWSQIIPNRLVCYTSFLLLLSPLSQHNDLKRSNSLQL